MNRAPTYLEQYIHHYILMFMYECMSVSVHEYMPNLIFINCLMQNEKKNRIEERNGMNYCCKARFCGLPNFHF